MTDSQALQFLAKLPFFAGLPRQDLESLSQNAIIHSYDKFQPVFSRGDAAHSFFVVMSGWVKLSRDTQEGDEAILGLMTRGDTFGESVMFQGEPYPYSAIAVEPSKVIAIPAQQLKARAKENTDILLRMMQSLSQQMNRLQLENEHLSLMSASQRVGCLLLQLSPESDDVSAKLHFPYDKSLAASKLGMKPETFSRALGQLKTIGIQTEGDVIQIRNMTELVDYVCSDCSAADGDCRFSNLHHCSPEDKAACQKMKRL